MKRVVHIHVPRTAGSSVNVWAMNNIPLYQSVYPLTAKTTFDSSAEWTYLGHTSPGDLRERGLMDWQWWGDSFRFGFVRNTWARVVSFYERRRNKIFRKEERPFVDFAMDIVEGYELLPSQLHYFRYGVDFVGRYENLKDEWKTLCKLIGMEYKPMQQHRRCTSRRGEVRDYRSYYASSKLVDAIGSFYAEEIREYGFKF